MFFWYREVLLKYADFSGRARRREFWMFYLANIVIAFPILFGGVAIGMMLGNDAVLMMVGGLQLLYLVYALAMFIPQLAVSVRRLHDTGRSGWWMLISFVPFGSLILLVLFAQEGIDGDNVYGPDPKSFGDLDARVDDLGDESFYSDNIYAQSARYRAL
ncbi:MAG: DUF805 domain-containing protein [Bacteroidota bacterium]